MTEDTFKDGVLETVKECARSSSKSNKKLKILHPLIAKLVMETGGRKLDWSYKCLTESNTSEIEVTFGENNTIRCDIALYYRGVLCGIFLVKHLYCSINKNKKNLFDNVTAEALHTNTMGVPLFEVLVLADKTPVFGKDDVLSFETPNLDLWYPFSCKGKSETNIDKMLIYSFTLPDYCQEAKTKSDYNTSVQAAKSITKSDVYTGKFGETVVYNDELKFASDCFEEIRRYYKEKTGFSI
jgi:hypothetical protein